MERNIRNGVITLFFTLFGFWFVLASTFSIAEVIIGVVASVLIVVYSFDLIFDKEETSGHSFRVLLRYFALFVVLVIEVIKANVAVVKIVLSPRISIKPGFRRIRQPLKRELNQALYGNSITLTPGTLAVTMSNDSIVVHGLTMENIDAIEGGPIQKAFLAIEQEDKR